MNSFAKLLPESIKSPLRNLRRAVNVFLYRGVERYCPICERSSRKFLRFGVIKREDARCPYCDSLERHRFVWVFMKDKTNLFDSNPKKMLHVAPERCFIPALKKKLGENYLTADLDDHKAMIKMDITNIDFPDEYFDVIFCSHVLEHVQNDIKAMKEFYRTLKRDGWAILLVPILGEKTYENSIIQSPGERLKVFGHEDHVRIYGLDYPDRLRQAGFNVEIINVNDLVKNSDALKMGLTSASGEIYFCTK